MSRAQRLGAVCVAAALSLWAPAALDASPTAASLSLLAQQTGGSFGGARWSSAPTPPQGTGGGATTTADDTAAHTPPASSSEREGDGAGGALVLLVLLVFGKALTFATLWNPVAGLAVLSIETAALFRLFFLPWGKPKPSKPPAPVGPEDLRWLSPSVSVLHAASLTLLAGLLCATGMRLARHGSGFMLASQARVMALLCLSLATPCAVAAAGAWVAVRGHLGGSPSLVLRGWRVSEIAVGVMVCAGVFAVMAALVLWFEGVMLGAH